MISLSHWPYQGNVGNRGDRHISSEIQHRDLLSSKHNVIWIVVRCVYGYDDVVRKIVQEFGGSVVYTGIDDRVDVFRIDETEYRTQDDGGVRQGEKGPAQRLYDIGSIKNEDFVETDT